MATNDISEKGPDELLNRVHAELKLVEERRAKLTELRKAGSAFPNDFRRNDLSSDLHQQYGEHLQRNVGSGAKSRDSGGTHGIETGNGQGKLRHYPGYERAHPALHRQGYCRRGDLRRIQAL